MQHKIQHKWFSVAPQACWRLVSENVHGFRCDSVRLCRREGEKRKTRVGLLSRVLAEPAAIL